MEQTKAALAYLRSVIAETQSAQRELLVTIDLLESLPWPLLSATDGETIYRVETGLHKLYVRLGRMLNRGEHRIPALDEYRIFDELVDHSADPSL